MLLPFESNPVLMCVNVYWKRKGIKAPKEGVDFEEFIRFVKSDVRIQMEVVS